METTINIGIANLTEVWKNILTQLGASFSPVQDDAGYSLGKHSLIIVNKPLSPKSVDICKHYLRSGGAIIDCGYLIDKIISGTFNRCRKSFIIPHSQPFKQPVSIIDSCLAVNTFSKAQHLDKTLCIDTFGSGVIAFLGLPIEALFSDTRSKRKEFPAKTLRLPNEEVAAVSKGEILRLLFYLIKHLHSIRRIPFIHAWFFPDTAKNVFLFRIDSDYGSKKQIRTWYEMGKEHAITYTWFLHAAAHEQWIDLFHEFKGHEIALHGYDHVTSKRYAANKINVQKAIDVFTQHRFPATGFASPYGSWNDSLQKVFEESGFLYTSEFSCNYDSLPGYPVINNRTSPVLQIPIHPICIGSLIKAKAGDKEILAYFIAQCDYCIRQCNPIILYDHVLHAYPHLLKELFTHIRSLQIPVLTFSEYALWWKKRESVVFSAQVRTDNHGEVSLPGKLEGCFLCIWTDENRYVLTNTSGSIPSGQQQKIIADSENQIDFDIMRRARRWNPRLYKESMLTNLFWRNKK